MLPHSPIPSQRTVRRLPVSAGNSPKPKEQSEIFSRTSKRDSAEQLSKKEPKTTLNSEERFYCELMGVTEEEKMQLIELMNNDSQTGFDDDFSPFIEEEESKKPKNHLYLEAIAKFLNAKDDYNKDQKAIALFRIAMSFYVLDAAKAIAKCFDLKKSSSQLYADMRDEFFKCVIEHPYEKVLSNENPFDCSPEQSKNIIEAAIKKIRDFAEIFQAEKPDDFLKQIFENADLKRTTSTGYTPEEKDKLSNHFSNVENLDEQFMRETGFSSYYKFLLRES